MNLFASARLDESEARDAGGRPGGVEVESQEGGGGADDAEVIGREVGPGFLTRDRQSAIDPVPQEERSAAPFGEAGAGEGGDVAVGDVADREGHGDDPPGVDGLSGRPSDALDDGCAGHRDEVTRSVAGSDGDGVAAGNLLAEGGAVESDHGSEGAHEVGEDRGEGLVGVEGGDAALEDLDAPADVGSSAAAGVAGGGARVPGLALLHRQAAVGGDLEDRVSIRRGGPQVYRVEQKGARQDPSLVEGNGKDGSGLDRR